MKLNATEAAELAKFAANKEIWDAIAYFAERGKYSFFHPYRLPQKTKDSLIEEGYKIQEKESGSTRISWEQDLSNPISAKEFAEKTKPKLLDQIMGEIEKESSQGRYRYTYNYRLPMDVKEVLEARGFGIYESYAFAIISWFPTN